MSKHCCYLWQELRIFALWKANRQKKIAGVLQQDLAEILQGAARSGGMQNLLISVTQVKVTVDLSIAKVYLSIFPKEKSLELMEGISSNAPLIKHELAQRTRDQLRRVPSLEFFIDDSLEYLIKLNVL